MDTTRPTDAPAASRRLPYIGALDGLRALCLLAVMAYHGAFDRASGGFLGVSTFFTLSGFLITSLLLKEISGSSKIDLGRFWAARARRLLPAAGVMLVIVVAFARLAASSTQLAGLRQDLWASFGLVINWRLALSGRAYGGYVAAASPVQHLWSLAIEEQFYLLLPVVVAGCGWLARRRGVSLPWTLGVAAAALAVGSTVARALAVDSGGDVTWAYYATHTRASELLVGVALACAAPTLLAHRLARRAIPVVGVVGGLILLGAWVGADQAAVGLYGPGLTVYALASTAVIASTLIPSPVTTALDTAPLRAIGRISYGAYLYHWPLFSWLDSSTVGLDGIPLFAVQSAVTLALAGLSHRFIEMPIRRRETLPRVPAPALGAALAFALLLTMAVPWRTVDTGPSGVEVAAGQRVAPVSVAARSTTPPSPDQPARPTVEKILLVGDSIPQQLAPYVAGTLPDVEVRWIGRAGVGPLSDQGALVGDVEVAVATDDPDVVVFHFAGSYLERQSGAEPYRGPDGQEVADGSEEMFALWDEQVDRLLRVATRRGATVLWALVPTIDPDNWFGYLADTVDRFNASYRELDGVTLLDWHALTAGPDGGFTTAMTNAAGATKRGRASDGLHFSAFGNTILANGIADEVERWPGRTRPSS